MPCIHNVTENTLPASMCNSTLCKLKFNGNVCEFITNFDVGEIYPRYRVRRFNSGELEKKGGDKLNLTSYAHVQIIF